MKYDFPGFTVFIDRAVKELGNLPHNRSRIDNLRPIRDMTDLIAQSVHHHHRRSGHEIDTFGAAVEARNNLLVAFLAAELMLEDAAKGMEIDAEKAQAVNLPLGYVKGLLPATPAKGKKSSEG